MISKKKNKNKEEERKIGEEILSFSPVLTRFLPLLSFLYTSKVLFFFNLFSFPSLCVSILRTLYFPSAIVLFSLTVLKEWRRESGRKGEWIGMKAIGGTGKGKEEGEEQNKKEQLEESEQ